MTINAFMYQFGTSASVTDHLLSRPAQEIGERMDDSESVRVANKAVAACLCMLSTAEVGDIDMDEVLYMLACVLRNPWILT